MSGVYDAMFGGDDASDAAGQAAGVSAGAQQQALDYLKSEEEIPSRYRKGATAALGGFYGLPGEGGKAGGEQEIIDQVLSSPMYSSMLEQGDEAVLRNASATGGLRSGNVQEALSQNAQNVLNSLVSQKVSGLAGLAGLPSGAGQIAGAMSDIGRTKAQGITGAAQAKEYSGQSATSNLLGLGALGLQAYNAFSDIRLKDNIAKVGEQNGHEIFTWTWNDEAEKLGLSGEGRGVIADRVEKYCPEAVSMSNGYKNVNYKMLGLA